MKIIKVEKKRKKGEEQKYRTIYAQTTADEKHRYRSLAWILEKIYSNKENNFVAHGFMPNKNCVTNAMQHVNKSFTLSMDFKDFFDHVTLTRLVKNKLNKGFAEHLLFDGSARQGLASSPMAANIATIGFDNDILELIKDTDCIYTRYADDISISSDNIELLKSIRNRIPNIAKKHRFKINHKKTRIQSAKFGRRIITGIAVDESCRPTRKNRRKLRTLVYKYNKATEPALKKYYERKIKGLNEFLKCKLPNAENKERLLKFYPKYTDIIRVMPTNLISPEWIFRKGKFDIINFRVIVERLGIERCMKYLKYKIIDEDINRGYRLLHINLENAVKNGTFGRIERVYLEMKNPSVEGVVHIEGVDPTCSTIKDAINYRRYGTKNNPIKWEPIQLS